MSYLKLAIAFAKARGRKRHPHLPSVSSAAVVHTDLNPHGSVLADGELWRAESVDGQSIGQRQIVTIIGFRDHLLLVEAQS